MSYGFTGTRNGTTAHQKRVLEIIFADVPRDTEFHHGDCVGADEDAHTIFEFTVPEHRIIIHPPEDPTWRAFCKGYFAIHDPLPFLHRNKIIVNSCKTLIACPEDFQEKQRSGTWSTIRFARSRKVPRIIIWPDGTIKEEA